jgi:uncharacterized protein YdhG (YjbR/CyaY superfamily)
MSPAASVEEYVAGAPPSTQVTLTAVRQTIRAALPDADEVISYGVPTFKQGGKAVVGFGYGKTHCSFYAFSDSIFAAAADDLKGYDVSKGTVRWPIGAPVPVGLIEKTVRARVAENEARGTKKK